PTGGQFGPLVYRADGCQLFNIGTGTKGTTGGRQDDDPNGKVSLQFAEDVIQLFEDDLVEEIRRRVVQGDHRNALGNGNDHELVSHRRPFSPVICSDMPEAGCILTVSRSSRHGGCGKISDNEGASP